MLRRRTVRVRFRHILVLDGVLGGLESRDTVQKLNGANVQRIRLPKGAPTGAIPLCLERYVYTFRRMGVATATAATIAIPVAVATATKYYPRQTYAAVKAGTRRSQRTGEAIHRSQSAKRSAGSAVSMLEGETDFENSLAQYPESAHFASKIRRIAAAKENEHIFAVNGLAAWWSLRIKDYS